METGHTTNSESLMDLLDALNADRWRQENPFSPDMEDCQQRLFDPTNSRQEKADTLLAWLGSPNQPCLFGRMAAKKGWLSVCILTETELARGDDYVRQVIQEHRRTWKREALSGKRHGFIISAVSQRLAYAQPGPVLQKMTLRLSDLYLSETGLNEVLHDSMNLAIARRDPAEYRRWKVGANLFASQADGRWWHDHRIPGGLAFSMNSVGHMARKLVEEAIQSNAELAERVARMPVEKLETWALPLAMRTIQTASRGRIPGTWLIGRQSTPAEDDESENERRAALRDLSEYDEDRYQGKYHTDQTVPAEYFDPGPDRPAGLADHDLYFTYLHRESDLDYQSMGLGEAILRTLQLDEERETGNQT
jgi:hypothetical protein